MLRLLSGYYEALRECGRALPTCDAASFEEFLTGLQLDERRRAIAEWQANGYDVANIESLTYEVLEVHLEGDLPFILICERDGTSLVQRRPGEADVIIEEGYYEAVREVQLGRVAGDWRIRSYATRQEVAGEVGALCA